MLATIQESLLRNLGFLAAARLLLSSLSHGRRACGVSDCAVLRVAPERRACGCVQLRAACLVTNRRQRRVAVRLRCGSRG